MFRILISAWLILLAACAGGSGDPDQRASNGAMAMANDGASAGGGTSGSTAATGGTGGMDATGGTGATSGVGGTSGMTAGAGAGGTAGTPMAGAGGQPAPDAGGPDSGTTTDTGMLDPCAMLAACCPMLMGAEMTACGAVSTNGSTAECTAIHGMYCN